MLRPMPLVISNFSSETSFSTEKKSKLEVKPESKRSDIDKKKAIIASQINLGSDKQILFSKKKV